MPDVRSLGKKYRMASRADADTSRLCLVLVSLTIKVREIAGQNPETNDCASWALLVFAVLRMSTLVSLID